LCGQTPEHGSEEKYADAGELVREFFLRKKFIPAAHGASAFLHAIALIAIHEFFRSDVGRSRTGAKDRPWINLHSSYLDLQCVYGYNEKIANSLRTFQGGKLKHNAIAEDRMDRLPVSKSVLILLSREHNHVCDELVARYADRFNTDELLYQQARLIMGGVFTTVVLRDYAGSIFSEWSYDGANVLEARGPKRTPPMGFHTSYEFNIMYRWHALIPNDFNPAQEPPKLESDDEIAKVLQDARNTPAGLIIANNTPEVMLEFERRALEQTRTLGMERFNEFRVRLGLSRYRSFESMTGGNAEMSARLRKFYATPDDVELYIGFMVERRLKGGLQQPITLGYTILMDAFSSIVHDRFYTTDWNADVYTEWGFQHASRTGLVEIVNRHLHLDVPTGTPLAKMLQWLEQYNASAGRSAQLTTVEQCMRKQEDVPSMSADMRAAMSHFVTPKQQSQPTSTQKFEQEESSRQ